MVNGPEDLPRVDLDAVDWDSIVWAGPAREVERLRQRIFKGRGLAEGQESAEADVAFAVEHAD